MLTTEEKTALINAIKDIDVKKITCEHENTNIQKWYRFGTYLGLRMACDIIKALPEPVTVS